MNLNVSDATDLRAKRDSPTTKCTCRVDRAIAIIRLMPDGVLPARRRSAGAALAVLVLVACVSRRGVDAELWGATALDDSGSVWDNLLASSAWRADEPAPPHGPQAPAATERPVPDVPTGPATLACNYSDWLPLPAWPGELPVNRFS